VSNQLILQGYCAGVIDPEGDHRSPAALAHVIMLSGDDTPPHPHEPERALQADVGVVLDLSKLLPGQKVNYLGAVLPVRVAFRRRDGLPIRSCWTSLTAFSAVLGCLPSGRGRARWLRLRGVQCLFD
jgi:hypothetical protein